MSEGFDARKDMPAVRKAQAAYAAALLDELLPVMRRAARGAGYALAVHGSLARDIDLIAVPWTVHPCKPELLVARLLGAISSVTGRATKLGEPTLKPHGRMTYTLIHGGHECEIDLSVMLPVEFGPFTDEQLDKKADDIVHLVSGTLPAEFTSEEFAHRAARHAITTTLKEELTRGS